MTIGTVHTFQILDTENTDNEWLLDKTNLNVNFCIYLHVSIKVPYRG